MWPTNQKVIKGRVKCKQETLSLARLDHSCIWNPLLEMVSIALMYNGGCAYASGVSWWQKAQTCRIVAILGRLSHQASCPLWRGCRLNGFLGVWPRSMEIALVDGLSDWGWDLVGWRPPWLGRVGRTPFELYLGLFLTTEEKPLVRLAK
jgi:hypothetical protein